MGATNTFERQIIRHFLRNTSQTPVATLYVGLFTAVADEEAGSVTEASGTGYARQSVAFDDDTAGATQNTAAVTFPVAGASWGTITHIGIYDASSAGNLLIVLALSASRAVASGEQLVFAIGDIDVSVT
jgi:hypothetical protein